MATSLRGYRSSAVEDLVTLAEVVRRVVAARVSDAHLVEDLTQEALVHVAAANPNLSTQARQAYAIVTARNVVISHARTEAVHERHAHRLVDYTNLEGPEVLTLEREETDALATALQRLDPADRDLLVRHEADGESTEALAAEASSTAGAIAMRLARARSALRLEFLLAFRRIELPTPRCRAVLLALSAGDRRRQRRLDSARHLRHCSTCAELAQPVAGRRRGIAAWLLVPSAEVIRRALRSLRHNHWTQAFTGVAAVAGIAAVATVIASGGEPQPVAAPAPAATSTAVTTTVAATTTLPTTTAPAVAATTTLPTTTAPAVAACPPPAPLDQLQPAAVVGCGFAPTTLTVVDVPADEGFWARTATGQTVWVQLVGTGESPESVRAGSALVVHGTVAPPSAAGDAPVTADGFILQVPYDAVSAGEPAGTTTG